MTAHTTPSPARTPLDTHDMVVIHRAFRGLIWPLLRARADLQADVVLRMEAQHEQVAASLDRVLRRDVLPRLIWQTAGRVLYARYTRRVRGRPNRPAAS